MTVMGMFMQGELHNSHVCVCVCTLSIVARLQMCDTRTLA